MTQPLQRRFRMTTNGPLGPRTHPPPEPRHTQCSEFFRQPADRRTNAYCLERAALARGPAWTRALALLVCDRQELPPPAVSEGALDTFRRSGKSRPGRVASGNKALFTARRWCLHLATSLRVPDRSGLRGAGRWRSRHSRWGWGTASSDWQARRFRGDGVALARVGIRTAHVRDFSGTDRASGTYPRSRMPHIRKKMTTVPCPHQRSLEFDEHGGWHLSSTGTTGHPRVLFSGIGIRALPHCGRYGFERAAVARTDDPRPASGLPTASRPCACTVREGINATSTWASWILSRRTEPAWRAVGMSATSATFNQFWGPLLRRKAGRLSRSFHRS
jgi:hypothetical protein